MSSEPKEILLPGLMDNARLRTELGVTKAAADRIMRALPKVAFEGLRKVYVKRTDLAKLIEARTFNDRTFTPEERAVMRSTYPR